MFLNRIRGTKEREVAELAATFSLTAAEKTIATLPPCRGFIRSLRERPHRSIGLIAEVKKASPSKGLIRADFDPVQLGRAYEAAGADCLSVLTDRDYFQGANDFLTAVKQAVTLPILRKDFTIDYRQIYEARLIGADAVLLIAAMLTSEELASFAALCADLGMDALVEVHNRAELETVLELPILPQLIGINNRNLHIFETSLTTTEQLAGLIPPSCTIVSESGISAKADVERLYGYGARAVLIGEHFMRQPEVGEAVHALLGPVDDPSTYPKLYPMKMQPSKPLSTGSDEPL